MTRPGKVIMLRYYPAVIHKEPDSDFGVSFPDFPGCITAGHTQSEALAMGKEALALHISGMLEDGDAIPEPTPLDAVQAALRAEGDDDGVVTLIEAALAGPSKRINVTFEEALLEEIDSAAAAMGLNRSAFLAYSARDKLDGLLQRRLAAVLENDDDDRLAG